jgi:hypothetical protein
MKPLSGKPMIWKAQRGIMKIFRSLSIALLIFVVGCGNQTPSTPADDAVTDTEPAIQTGNSSNRLPLPNLDNLPAPQILTSAVDDPRITIAAPVALTRAARTRGLVSPRGVPAGTQTRVKLKLLLITATDSETGFDAMKTFLTRMGVPFDVLVASQNILTSDKLESEPGLGNYSGVILTTNNLAYFDGTNWLSAFDPIEWQILSDFERDYKVRQVTMYAYPDGANTGLNYIGYADTSSTALNVSLTTQGKQIFSDLKPDISIGVRQAYTYLAQVTDGAIPLIQTANGAVVAALHTALDGREGLAVTTAHNQYLTHSVLLSYGLVRWVSRGVFLGEQKMYFAVHSDDYFIDNDVWNPSTHANGGVFRLRANDLISLALWQQLFRFSNPLFSSFTVDHAFNGEGYQMNSRSNCFPVNSSTNDALSAATHCYHSAFRWINHTFGHLSFDDTTSLADVNSQISQNLTVATGLGGLRLSAREFDPSVLVTGNHSGLGYFDEVLPLVNAGKSRASVNLINGAQALGIRVMASNTSAPTTLPICTSTPEDCSQNNPSPNQGQRFPSNLPANDILLEPRFPINIFYNTTTPVELTDEYNTIYRAYWGRDLSFQEIMDFESDVVVSHILSGSVNPHYVHQSNLRNYGNGNCLLCVFMKNVATKYAKLKSLPVQNPSMADIAKRLLARTAYDNAGASAIWNKTTGALTVSANNPTAIIPLTNPLQGTQYGPDRVLNAVAGTTIVIAP